VPSASASARASASAPGDAVTRILLAERFALHLLAGAQTLWPP